MNLRTVFACSSRTLERLKPIAFIALAACLAGFSPHSAAQTNTVLQLTNPGQFTGSPATIHFDFSAAGAAANTVCLGAAGVEFRNFVDAPVPIYDWAVLDRQTTSQPHVIATVSSHGGTFSSFLDLLFTDPKTEVGAYFGNDQGTGMTSITLSVFGADDVFLGSFTVSANQNTSVDQFIGLRSSTPFVRARFQNNPASFLSVILDDVVVSAPPSASALGTISTIAGSEAEPLIPYGVVAHQGVVYVADQAKHTVWRINSDGSKTAIAGNGEAGFNGDGIEAVIAQLHNPMGLAVDSSGSLYIADSGNHAIRKVASPGTSGAVIVTVAGVAGPENFAVDSPTLLYAPRAVAIGPGDSIYIADTQNQQIRRVLPGSGGVIENIAGVGGLPGTTDGPASCAGTEGCIPARFNSPTGLAVDSGGKVYVTDEGSSRLRVISSGTVRTLASGASAPTGVAVTPDGSTLYVADYGNHRVRRLAASGDCNVSGLVAGTGTAGFSNDDPAAATSTPLNSPQGVALDGGVVYIADKLNGRVRKVVFPVIN